MYQSQTTTKIPMDTLAEKLDRKLRQWQPEVADQVRQRISEIINMADQDILDILRSRTVEQDVLDLLDEPETR
jgi:exonuclease V gamma subunit